MKLLPVRRVGVHVPGFSAVLPSSVIMTCVPAQVAGVKEIAVCSPPNASGRVSPETLACCGMLGVEEVYRMGGAQAIAALAFGTASVRKVDMVAGPGNLFTTLAKKEVFGEAAIDILAGPSEVLVIADESARAEVVAADMLAQAEHAPAAAILVTPSEALAKAVAAEVEKQLQGLSRRDRAAAVMEEYSLAIVTGTMEEAVDLANDLAPEHLEIITSQDDAVLSKIRNAGTVFVGGWTPTAAGDYIAGPSHTLPTGGTARFLSGLSANSFLRRMSIVRYDEGSLEKDREDIVTLAEAEGLTAHAESVRIRFRKHGSGDVK
jgi:histidinol dehydrogenase